MSAHRMFFCLLGVCKWHLEEYCMSSVVDSHERVDTDRQPTGAYQKSHVTGVSRRGSSTGSLAPSPAAHVTSCPTDSHRTAKTHRRRASGSVGTWLGELCVQ
ncbi:hypothetical protein B0T10DRAFT_469637 [Thelonectria olida]|uniref:Secreted protein n=1 Tax=Thelonectria olida TaxID=1576542 RepID=A0A9P8WIT1_9HYPO|nr:hypothetical protein B0T10DRAFT_469637 [Thelonectria olida]